MEILDPDLWNDDGSPRKPSQSYMRRLEEAQDLQAVDPETPKKIAEQQAEAYRSYVRIQAEAKAMRPASVGDIVHLWDNEIAKCRAALVLETAAFDHSCELQVFVPHEEAQFWNAAHDEDKAPDTWHWPEGDH